MSQLLTPLSSRPKRGRAQWRDLLLYLDLTLSSRSRRGQAQWRDLLLYLDLTLSSRSRRGQAQWRDLLLSSPKNCHPDRSGAKWRDLLLFPDLNLSSRPKPKAQWRDLLLLLLLLLLLAPAAARAQLPAGTTSPGTEAQQPTSPADDKLRTDAAAALERRDFPAALKALTALATQHPNDARILFDLGSTEDALADSPAQNSPAEQTYRRAIAAEPTMLEPHLALGLLLARNGHDADARSELLTATTLQKGDPALRATAFRALAHLDQHSNPAEARDALLDALKLSPETPADTLLSGELAEAAGDLPSAEAAFRRLLAAHPGDTDATSALAAVLRKENKPAEADKLLADAAAAHPDDPALAARLATSYARAGDLPRAIALVAPLHQAHPDEPSLTQLLAHLLALSGDYATAEPLLAQLRAQNPGDPTLADQDADALIRLHRPAEAETLLKAAVARPETFPSHDALGEAAGHLAFAASANNDPETVLQAVSLRATVLPQSPATLFLEATARDKLHQFKEAQLLYRQFLSLSSGKFPDEEWEARHRLLALAHTH